MPPVSGNNWGQHAPRLRAARPVDDTPAKSAGFSHLRSNQPTPWTPQVSSPQVPSTSYVDPTAVIWGDVRLGERVLVAPLVSVRADEGAPIWIGPGSNLQDGVVIHGLPSHMHGAPVPVNQIEIEGERYSVYVAGDVSVEHQAQLHGPVHVAEGVWIGMKALVSGARIGRGVVIEPGAAVLGVTIPEHRYVPAGVVVNRQQIADQLPEITASYPLRHRNRASLHASRVLTEAYARAAR